MNRRGVAVLYRSGLAVRLDDVYYACQKDSTILVHMRDGTKMERYVHSQSLRNYIIRTIDEYLNNDMIGDDPPRKRARADEDDDFPPKRPRAEADFPSDPEHIKKEP